LIHPKLYETINTSLIFIHRIFQGTEIMKIAISGKGGVGKTTLAGCLARFWADKGKTVLAVDADPDSNLHSALGVSAEVAASITPLAQMKDLVAERTGAQPGSFGGMFKLNPKVDDIPDEFGVQHGNIRCPWAGEGAFAPRELFCAF